MRRSVHGVTKPRTHLISAGLMIAAASVSVFSACNSNPVEFLSSNGSIQKTLPRSASSQQKMDILWVVDNSGSMCQEQKFLGENFDKFINGLSQTQLDFHLAVTTTHVPGSAYAFEPVAKAGHIQSTPQPVPTFDQLCRGSAANNFQQVRDALASAVSCMTTPDNSFTQWTNDQIGCALRDQLGMMCPGVADRDGNGTITPEDLFPLPSEYRPIPKFLKSADYRAANGQLDTDRLRADFACMSLVGTRGTGYEKGLKAAIMAVSPELTGLAPEAADADATKPNHGFIRKDSGTAVIFVTDENDCSNDGTIAEPGSGQTSVCGVETCDYWASEALADQSPLLKPEEFKAQFLDSLAKTKGIAKVEESTIIMAGIFGQWRPFEGMTFPVCNGNDKPAVPIACADAVLGESRSGDRYQRSIRQFLHYFPNDRSKAAPLDFSLRDTGWMCQGDFSPALTAIGQFIGQNPAGCIQDQVFPCESDADCPTQAYGDAAGKCLPFGEPSDTNDKKFCDTGVMITIERDPEQNATVDDINAQEYCLPGTIGALPGKGRGKNPLACVVDPARYQWISCPAGSGIQLKWAEADATVATKLAGYNIDQVFNVAIPDPIQ
jgi:hypothetical protein